MTCYHATIPLKLFLKEGQLICIMSFAFWQVSASDACAISGFVKCDNIKCV